MSAVLMDGRSLIAEGKQHYQHHRVLKSKENTFKPKCNKALKKKLKKYRLRKDGKEDPDVIDVSQSLITSLRIKSPNNQHTVSQKVCECDENRPYNYLTKMVRQKKIGDELEPIQADVLSCNKTSYDEIIPKSELEIKQNAFKLLMDSRNKSIGSNSPGKEKCEEEFEAQERAEKKELKAKRLLSLNKMAEAKGSQKKIDMEEQREENIKKKMENRAKRLKEMLEGAEVRKGRQNNVKATSSKLENNHCKVPNSKDDNDLKHILTNKSPILKTFDLFNDMKANASTNLKKTSKEDEQFLQKLKPSIRKKENMLCYFQKIRRDAECVQDEYENDLQDDDPVIIKVKLTPKPKVKKNKTKSSFDDPKNLDAQVSTNNGPQTCASVHPVTNGPKRKRHTEVETCNEQNLNNNNDVSLKFSDEGRPKRNSKKPVKYSDEFQLTSSDEELYIFTPKKKRKEKLDKPDSSKDSKNSKTELKHEDTSCKSSKQNQRKVKRLEVETIKTTINTNTKANQKDLTTPKKATKLAPIFVAKPQLDTTALEAKKKFLNSGVPSQLKKNYSQQNSIQASDEFPTVLHVQNLTNINVNINNFFDPINSDYTEDVQVQEEENLFQNLLHPMALEDHSLPSVPNFEKNVDQVLKKIKTAYPRFPVYRSYHLLKAKSKGEFRDCIYPDLDNSIEIFNNIVDTTNINPDKLNWSEKYKPSTEKQVIGNFDSIKELRNWLVTWTENNVNAKSKKDETDSSDFYQSDTDSRETMKNVNNLLIITGKVGSGKTLGVYAVAASLAIKVIEVNVSSKRTGKIMLQDLQEATQSHKVDRGKSSTESSQKSQEVVQCDVKMKVMKKRGRKKKVAEDYSPNAADIKEAIVTQENTRTGMSLILIDDADIVFDQDDGFCSAISQLIQTSKRPVILVTSSLTCPHLQKFVNLAKIIKMRPFLPRMLGTWLDIICLVDSNMCCPGLGIKTLDLFKGDIRKTINYLHFFITSQKYLSNMDGKEITQGEEILKGSSEEENSCMSWADNIGWAENAVPVANLDDITAKNFMTRHLHLHCLNSFNNFNVWWNLPDLLNYSNSQTEKSENKTIHRKKSNDIRQLNMIANTLDTLSITDYLDRSILNEDIVTSSPWYLTESASVIDAENFASYNRRNECISDIVFELMTKGILKCKNKTDINPPAMSVHRERDRIVSRHKILTSYLHPSAVMDRRALMLDYWSSCRNICRSEKIKTDNNSKRNNRFCHYLKSLNVLCKNDYFDNLCESLNSDGASRTKDSRSL